MTIETKFSVQDNVFLLIDNQIQKRQIQKVYTSASQQEVAQCGVPPELIEETTYVLVGDTIDYTDSELFATVAELLTDLEARYNASPTSNCP